MINGISSSFSSYTSSTSATSSTGNKKFQEELLARLDTDGDGSIGKDELSSALSSNSKDGITVSLSKAFSDLDSNDDDSLDANELAAMAPPPPPMQSVTDIADDLLTSLDSDGDGAISSDELSTGLTSAGSSANSSEVFDALDTNEDGTVSLDELTASLQSQQPPAGPPPAQMSSTTDTDSDALFSALDSDSDNSISASELSAALKQSDSSDSSNGTTNASQMAAQALSKMIAALGERYDTEGSKPVGRYLNTAA